MIDSPDELTGQLETLIEELRRTSVRLRSEEVGPDEAAELVERAAQLASRLGTELDAAAATSSQEPPPDQERLL